MNARALIILSISILSLAPACQRRVVTGPPELRPGRDQCAHCGMMISDERCAGACIVEQDGDRSALVFDDIGCMIDYARRHDASTRIVAGFVRDYSAGQWIPAQTAHYLCAKPDQLVTPWARALSRSARSPPPRASAAKWGAASAMRRRSFGHATSPRRPAPSMKHPTRPVDRTRTVPRQERAMLSQTVEYALRAMMHIAGLHGVAVNSESIARVTNVPPGYLSKVLRDLVVANLVESSRGPGGGFRLAKAPEQISILDVVNAVEPIRRIQRCPAGNPAHPELCGLHRRVNGALAEIEREFRGTTLAQILSADVPFPEVAPVARSPAEPPERGKP